MREDHLKDIRGTSSRFLEGHRVALGVTGSIAAVEAPAVARELMRHGAEVHAVMTPAATRILAPAALRWATGNPVVTRLTGRVEHLELCGEKGICSLYLVAPATANTLAKMALALDDTPVTTVATTALGAGIPVVVAPGMHACMYRHPGVRQHLETLTGLGVRVVKPILEEAKAKLAAPEDIAAAVLEALGPGDLRGLGVLVSAGPTREYLDPVRLLTNPSSGRMGVELAREARRRGARVALVYGPASVPPPPGVRVVPVTTTREMARAVEEELRSGGYRVFVAAAAVADFAPVSRQEEKIPTAAGERTLRLVPTPKILHQARKWAPEAFVVGWKAEVTEDPQILIEAGRQCLIEARADLVAANPVALEGRRGFEAEDNEVWLVGAHGPARHLERAPKGVLARRFWDAVVPLLHRDAAP